MNQFLKKALVVTFVSVIVVAVGVVAVVFTIVVAIIYVIIEMYQQKSIFLFPIYFD